MDELLKNYTWAVDGLGRCFVCRRDSREIVYCGLPGVGGPVLLFDMEDMGSHG